MYLLNHVFLCFVHEAYGALSLFPNTGGLVLVMLICAIQLGDKVTVF